MVRISHIPRFGVVHDHGLVYGHDLRLLEWAECYNSTYKGKQDGQPLSYYPKYRNGSVTDQAPCFPDSTQPESSPPSPTWTDGDVSVFLET